MALDANTIMNLQYRKLLTAKQDLWAELGTAWEDEGDLVVSLAAAMSLYVLDLDGLSLPQMGESEQAFLGQMMQVFESLPEGEDVNLSLTHDQRDAMSYIAQHFRLSDAWHKVVALRFADFANATYPMLFIGRGVLEEIL